MNGNWETVEFFNCNFEGFFEDFRAGNISVTLSKENHYNNLQHLLNLVCGDLQIYASNFQITLQIPNIIGRKTVNLRNCICDLSCVKGKWNTLNFINCALTGLPNQQEFKNAKLMISNCISLDLSVFQQLQTQLYIKLQKQNVDLRIFMQIPTELSLQQCEVISYNSSKWNKISFVDCEFQGKGIIAAKEMTINGKLFQNIIAEHLNVNNSFITVINCKTINIKNSTIKILKDMNLVKSIQIIKCELDKFSILKFPNLEQFTLECDYSYNKDQNSTNMAIQKYLVFKIENKLKYNCTKKNMSEVFLRNIQRKDYNKQLIATVQCVMQSIIKHILCANE
ncbi:Hypothetical_protein [Hexamita inflata]|uniref:Hypothetical_protein n=1 Tax=Hexamita inflata TaxID=28002 RepID=A0AA86TJY8_9EUKA|nr:Hypothetical protein HINF_LOCUS5582 [Hexamita inflata]